ncbi:MAG: protein kinase [Lachnospiraceae bacterium]|nr:protein kinase [Lachnospiraceae bacterium]
MTQNTVELNEGTMLAGRYNIEKVIGAGGFGTTYKAYDKNEKRLCAIKEFMPKGIVIRLDDGKTIAPVSSSKNQLFEHGKDRFLEEAEILQRLNKVRAVVSVYDFFQENGTCYFVMEFLEGVTLGSLTKQKGGKLPYNIVADVVEKVGKALIQVHNYNIFHRDISPDNIFVTTQGEIKLIDFGNAKNLIRNDGENLSVVLKPGFAPPEQYSSSGKQGTFTDVYSLASTVYYVLSGKKVPDALDRCGSNGYVPLTEFGVPEYVSDAVDAALRLRYKDRTQTIDEFLIQMKLLENNTVVTNREYVPYIDGLSGILAGKKYTLPVNTTISFGRLQGVVTIPINNEHISKKHCEIFYDDISEKFYVVDGSTNGTFVNGEKLKRGEIYAFKPDFILGLGSECFMKVGVRSDR